MVRPTDRTYYPAPALGPERGGFPFAGLRLGASRLRQAGPCAEVTVAAQRC
jgi:hypothetical protein